MNEDVWSMIYQEKRYEMTVELANELGRRPTEEEINIAIMKDALFFGSKIK